MKITTLIITTIMLLLIATDSYARDLKLPRFKAKDALSADVLNDIMGKIEKQFKTSTASEIVGEWSCTSYHESYHKNEMGSGWSASSDGLYIYTTHTLTITSDKISSTAKLPFTMQGSNAFAETEYKVIDGVLYFGYASGGGGPNTPITYLAYKIDRTDDTQMLLTRNTHSDQTHVTKVDCSKSDLPPLLPTELTAVSDETGVDLTWTAQDERADTYIIYRKDSLEGDFTELTSTTTTEYSEDLDSGTYWYRVSAYNSYGESDKTSAVIVTIE